jgi:vitamin B12 transporter
MKFLGSIFLVCFLIISVSAQQGIVVSGQLRVNDRVISNTRIKLVSGDREFETTTDQSGNYRFENVADGTYLLVFGGNRIQVAVANGTFSISNIGEVVVIASGTNQPIDEVSKSVTIIGGQEMRDRADFALVETLRTVPGFRVQQLGGFGKTANIKTRGLRNQDTALLIDGIRFRDASAITGDASPFLSDFTLTSVSRLEILRGSGSSLYGTNAIGGVIGFVTPTPQKGFHGQLSTAFGGLGLARIRGNVSHGTENGKFGFNLGISRTVYSEGIDKDDDARNTNGLGRIEYNPFAKTNISARFYVGDSFVKLNSNPDTIGALPASNSQIIRAVPLSIAELNRYASGTPLSQLNRGNATFIPDTNDPDAFQKSQFFGNQLALTQILADNLVLKSHYQFLRTSRKNTNGVLGIGFQPFGGASTSIFNGLIHTFNSHLDWTLNRNNLVTIGYEYEWEKFTNRGLPASPAGNFETRARQTSNTIYAQNQMNFSDRRLQISVAGRAQIFSLKTPEFSSINAPYQNVTLENPPTAYTGDASAAYFFRSTGTKIRAHAGNGYRVPSLYERFGTFYATFLVPNQFVGLGAPDLEPERSIAFDGGIDQFAFKNRAQFSATYFYTRLINTIGYGTLPQPDSFGRVNSLSGGGYKNVKGGISRGAEFSGEIKATRSTDIFTSYTFTNSDQIEPQVAGSGIYKTLGVPAHQFTLVATQRFGKRFNVNFDFLATSSYLAPIFSNTTFRTYVYQFKGARRGDLSATYEIPAYDEKLRFRIYGTIENVFGYEYYENGFRTISRTARAGAGVSF